MWREAFYQELDAVKRQQMLKEREEVRNIGENADRTTAEIRFMEKLWIARYGKKTKKRCICRKSYGIKNILQKEAL